jgi:hypothetical protein
VEFLLDEARLVTNGMLLILRIDKEDMGKQ